MGVQNTMATPAPTSTDDPEFKACPIAMDVKQGSTATGSATSVGVAEFAIPSQSTLSTKPIVYMILDPEQVDDSLYQREEDVVSEAQNSNLIQEELDEEPRNIILNLIKQLTKGMDLHRIAFPTFVLEPRSMLERITDFMSHPQLLTGTSRKSSPLERFVDVVRYVLSGWHIKPKGVKKPYNPVLGEFFRCRWTCANGRSNFYIAEQVSHHPPISAYFYASPDNDLVAMGNFCPKSKFLGNSVMSHMQGTSHIFFINRPGEEYIITNPNIYARGILFGTMIMELGDNMTIHCPKTDLIAEIQFKVKGIFGGTYNAIAGSIRQASTNEVYYNLSGKWSDCIFIARPKQSPVIFFDASTPIITKKVEAISRQDPFESQRLWQNVTEAIIMRDYERANIQKAKVEEEQRQLAKLREDNNISWRPKFFQRDDHGDFWHFIDSSVYSDQLQNSPSGLHEHMEDFFGRHFTLGADAPSRPASRVLHSGQQN